MTNQPSDATDEAVFPPSQLPRGAHFLRGDFVEMLSMDATFEGRLVPGTPGVVLGLSDPVAVDVAWVAREGGIVYGEVYDQDHLGRLSSEEFDRRRTEIRHGQRPPAKSDPQLGDFIETLEVGSNLG